MSNAVVVFTFTELQNALDINGNYYSGYGGGIINYYASYPGGIQSLITDAYSVCNLSAIPSEGISYTEKEFINEVTTCLSGRVPDLNTEFNIRFNKSTRYLGGSFDLESNLINLLLHIRSKTSQCIPSDKITERAWTQKDGCLILLVKWST